MNYYKEVKSAFDDWATTYESDVVPKLVGNCETRDARSQT